jgi:hypothetical protein
MKGEKNCHVDWIFPCPILRAIAVFIEQAVTDESGFLWLNCKKKSLSQIIFFCHELARHRNRIGRSEGGGGEAMLVQYVLCTLSLPIGTVIV